MNTDSSYSETNDLLMKNSIVETNKIILDVLKAKDLSIATRLRIVSDYIKMREEDIAKIVPGAIKFSSDSNLIKKNYLS